jgi:hypothetical protein
MSMSATNQMSGEYVRSLTAITSMLKLFRGMDEHLLSDTLKLEQKSLEKRAERILSMIPLSPNAGAIFSIVTSRVGRSLTTLLRFTNRPATPLRGCFMLSFESVADAIRLQAPTSVPVVSWKGYTFVQQHASIFNPHLIQQIKEYSPISQILLYVSIVVSKRLKKKKHHDCIRQVLLVDCSCTSDHTEPITVSDTESNTAVTKTCSHCQKTCSQTCRSCRSVFYCSRSCQCKDWYQHKLICKRIKAERSIMRQKVAVDNSNCVT